MCGITGIIQASPLRTADHLHRMNQSITHRGPDGEGRWENESGTVLLGHRRLKVIDLSQAAAQPMEYIGRYTITYNGEIYNYIELRKELQNEGYSFRTSSDTEVILAAYACWQENCVDHFNGMFAFAIWDQVEQELFAARDRFGEKPFFYHLGERQLLFASEIKALWAAGIAREPNLQMLFNYLTIGYVDNPENRAETFFNGIHKLPPASRLFYRPGDAQPEIETYWELDSDEQFHKPDEREMQERLGYLLRASVKRRLRSDVPVGTSLSGGLDSSLIASLVKEELGAGQTFRSFTAGFPGFDRDESEWSATMARSLGIRQELIRPGVTDLVQDWETFHRMQEEPVGSASSFAQYKVFGQVRASGVTVMLDGQGADEILAGYGKYYKWYWQELFQKRRLLSSGEIRSARQLGVTEPFGIRNIIASLFPDLASVVLEKQYLTRALQQEDLHPDFVKTQSKEAYYTTPELYNLNGYLHFNTCVHGLEELLRYADRNSMAHSSEVRLPFLDHELVEFVFKLPASFKIRDGWTKWILRKVSAGRIPEDIAWRKDKTGFEPPQQAWMRDPQMEELLRAARQKLVGAGVLKKSVIDLPVRAMHAYEADNYDWRYLSAAACLFP